MQIPRPFERGTASNNRLSKHPSDLARSGPERVIEFAMVLFLSRVAGGVAADENRFEVVVCQDVIIPADRKARFTRRSGDMVNSRGQKGQEEDERAPGRQGRATGSRQLLFGHRRHPSGPIGRVPARARPVAPLDH